MISYKTAIRFSRRVYMKRLCGVLLTGVIMLALLSVQTGCGGGKADTSRPGGADANLTAASASQAGDALTQAVNLVLPTSALVQAKAVGVSSEKSAPLIRILEIVVPVVTRQAAGEKQANGIFHQDCSGGGSIDVGTPVPVSLSDPTHLKADVSVNNCRIGLEFMNGAMKVTAPASAIGDIQHIKDFTVEVSSFTYSDPHWSLSLTDSFTMIAGGISYDGSSVTGGSVTLGGSVSGTIDGVPVNIACDSLGFQFSSNSAGVTVWVTGGRINVSCLGGWVAVLTTPDQPVFLPSHTSCPTQGEITASAGGNTIKMNFSTVSGIRIFFNNTLARTLVGCSDLLGSCAAR
jgi:hypothetical protein